ncbi:MAG: hypothetical protein GX604_05510 [Actinobacteria bacterium]|nr:hypothetical protein [Actinomycetota bacterium]
MFIATDGTQPDDATKTGGAKFGDACYHDFLQPSSVAGPWDLISGNGAFKELEDGNKADQCGDIEQNVTNYYLTRVPVTVKCADGNGDGVVDPFSVCTSWDNNQTDYCTTVKNARPGTDSKCRCESVSPGLLIYRGYDWGDLPDIYKTITDSNGARHAIQDSDNNNTPNTQGGIPAVWLGPTVDHSPSAETDGQPNSSATGDYNANADDENGIEPVGEWTFGTNGGEISVNVNSSDGTCTGCRLGFWIDWNGDGDFADSGESYLEPVVFGPQTVKFDIPVGAQSNGVYARFRLYAGNYVGPINSNGLVVNGEVEDYYFTVPTAVELRSFKATAERNAIVLAWETTSEINNLGFNLYRAKKVDGERTRINAELIRSNVNPGSSSGATYEYPDTTFTGNRTFYYWLEAINIHGPNDLYGPIKARAGRGLDPQDPPSKTEVK